MRGAGEGKGLRPGVSYQKISFQITWSLYLWNHSWLEEAAYFFCYFIAFLWAKLAAGFVTENWELANTFWNSLHLLTPDLGTPS